MLEWAAQLVMGKAYRGNRMAEQGRAQQYSRASRQGEKGGSQGRMYSMSGIRKCECSRSRHALRIYATIADNEFAASL